MDKTTPPQKKAPNKNNKCLGPVSDLEKYVQPDWWRRIFDSLYLKTDADVVDDERITKAEVDLVCKILNLSREDRILDLACGHGRHSLELARRGFKHVEGLDRSRYLIRRARRQAEKEGLSVKFREGDARRLPYPPDSFDVVLILGNSFGYFDSIVDDLKVLKEAFRVLRPSGRILIDVADGGYLRENFQPRSWEWIDRRTLVCRERSLSVDKRRLISREVVINVDKGAIADRFYAERLYDRESLEEILKMAGFSYVAFHGTISPNSQRNQDLGMMGRRIIVTAVAKKDWAEARRRVKAVRTVAVVLGDPRKPDPVKPNRTFDDDDIYTINQLKAALKEIDGYHFIYLDNHDTLLHDLIKLRGKIDYVFNLCDEGYNNDPRKELNVPALLEVLNIPYTGSPPRCLSYCYDKALVIAIAKEMGIPVPETMYIYPGDTDYPMPPKFPVIVKPNFGDSSYGVTQRSVANNPEELINAVKELREKWGYDGIILVEEFLQGSDLTVGIIGNPPDSYVVLPIAEEDYSALPPGLPRICCYEAKWLPDTPYWNLKSKRAELPKEVERFIIDSSIRLFERLECRDYCRFDWRLDSEGNPKLLEVNPNPGWCWDGHLAKMASLAGISYSGMLKMILEAAEKRLGLANNQLQMEAAEKLKSPA